MIQINLYDKTKHRLILEIYQYLLELSIYPYTNINTAVQFLSHIVKFSLYENFFKCKLDKILLKIKRMNKIN